MGEPRLETCERAFSGVAEVEGEGGQVELSGACRNDCGRVTISVPITLSETKCIYSYKMLI